VLAVQWARHHVILDLRRDAVRDVWWYREAVQQTSTKLFVEQRWNEPSRRSTWAKWVVQEVLVGN